MNMDPKSIDPKSIDPTIAYHLRELDIASDPESPHHVMPDFSKDDRTILDIGCGIGQTLIAGLGGMDGRLLVGLDVDMTPLRYGHDRHDGIGFLQASGAQLPFADRSFDLVTARVSLPYTDLRRSLAESHRVLADGGRIWLTMHPFARVAADLVSALREHQIKDVAYRGYVILNGLVFNLFGQQFPFVVHGRYESFQTASGMGRALRRHGFVDVETMLTRKKLVCTARKLAHRST